jgi:hypothetical protein
MLEHGDARSMNAAAQSLLRERTFLPPDLRTALDEWLIKTVVPRAGRRVFGSDPERVQLDELLAIAGEPERRREAVDSLETLRVDPDVDVAALAVAMTDPGRRATLLRDASARAGQGFISTLDVLPDAFDIVADHAHDRWVGVLPGRLLHVGCDAHRREQLVKQLESAFATYVTHEKMEKLVDICATRSAELEPLFRSWLTPTTH